MSNFHDVQYFNACKHIETREKDDDMLKGNLFFHFCCDCTKNLKKFFKTKFNSKIKLCYNSHFVILQRHVSDEQFSFEIRSSQIDHEFLTNGNLVHSITFTMASEKNPCIYCFLETFAEQFIRYKMKNGPGAL